MTTTTSPAVAPRRVLLLLKAQGDFKHSGKYYLLNGRWHLLHAEKPAPKGVPLLREVPEGHDPSAHHSKLMTPDMWAKIYAHPDNSNKANFVKKLDQMKAAFDKGDAHAILAGNYPADTTHKKLAHIGNYLLHLLGSEHQIQIGQKKGEHAAVAGHAAPKAEQPKAEAPKAAEPKAEPDYLAKIEATSSLAAADAFGQLYLHAHGNSDEAKAKVEAAKAKMQANLPGASAPAPTASDWEPTFDDVMALQGKPHAEVKATMKDWADKMGSVEKLSSLINKFHHQAKAEKAKAEAAKPTEAEAAPKKAAEPAPTFAVGDTVAPEQMKHLAPGTVVQMTANGKPWRKALVGTNMVWFSKLNGDKGWQKKQVDPQHFTAFKKGQYGEATVLEVAGPDWMPEQQKTMAKDLLEAKQEKNPDIKAHKMGALVVVGKVGNPHSFAWINEDGEWGAGFTGKQEHQLETGQGLEPLDLGAAAAEQGPKEGDTKQGAEGTLVLKDGHWVKQGEEPAAKPKAKSAEDAHQKWLESMAKLPSIELDGEKWFVVAEGTKHANGTTHVHLASATHGSLKANGWGPNQINTDVSNELLHPAPAGGVTMPEFHEGKEKAGVKDYYEKVGQKVLDLVAAGDLAGLEAMKAKGLEPNKYGKVGNTWKGKTENSKILLAMHDQAVAQLKGAAPQAEPAAEPAPAVSVSPAAAVTAKIIGAGTASEAKNAAMAFLNEHDPSPENYDTVIAAMKKTGFKSMAATFEELKADEHGTSDAIKHKLKSVGAPDLEAHVKQLPDGKWSADIYDTALKKYMPNVGVFNTEGEALESFNSPSWEKPGDAEAKASAPVLPGTSPEPIKPDVSYSVMWGEEVDNIEKALDEGDTLKLEQAITNSKGLLSDGAKASFAYATAALDHLASKAMAEGVAASATTSEAMKSVAPYIQSQDYSQQAYANAVAALKGAGFNSSADVLAAGAKTMAETADANPAKASMIKQIAEAGSATAAITAASVYVDAQDKAQEAYDDVIDELKAHGYNGAANLFAEAKADAAKTKAKAGVSPAKQAMLDAMGGETDSNAVGVAASKYVASADHALGAWDDAIEALEAYGHDKLAAGFKAGKATTIEKGIAPKEGDTKMGADGMLVLKNGHWVKMEPDQPAMPKITALKPGQAIKIMASQGVKTASGNKAKLKALAVAGDVGGLQQFIADHPNLYASKKVAQALIDAMTGGAPIPQMAPKAAAAIPTPASTAMAAMGAGMAEEKPQPMDNWTKVGNQQGSNPGGKFIDPSGQAWYCKFPADEDHAKAEVLASKFYAAAGLSAQDAKLITKDGKVGIATKWTDIEQLAPGEAGKLEGAAEGFALDAWLGNRDVVGIDYANLQKGQDGKAHRVDAGASFIYRAQGGKKEFGDSVTELDTLLDPKYNAQTAKTFGHLTKADIAASVAKVLEIPDELINALVHHYGYGDEATKEALVQTLIARKADLAAKFPVATKVAESAPEKPPVYRIPTPPDFKNWNGPGKGLSSKAVFNEQNDQITDEIFKLGKRGDVEALSGMKFQPINEAGAAVGDEKPVAQHPSKHIPAYFNDVVKSMTTPYVSPKVAYRAATKNLGGAFKAMKHLFPGFKNLKESAKKLGRYAVLGKISGKGNPLANWKPTIVSRKAGTLDEKTLFELSQKGYAQLSGVEKQAIKDYTGSGYTSMNNALIQGKNHDMAYNAIKATEKASVPLPAGAVISRRFSFDKAEDGSQSQANHDKAIAEIIAAGPGSVLQEFGIISTSTRSDFWHGRVHLKITIGEGVKGLYVANDPEGYSGKSPISSNPGESEIMLPYGTKFMVTKVHPKGHGFTDEDGSWGKKSGDEIVIEVTALPNM